MLVLLDNGHGKETPGKRSPVWKDGTSQIFEWEYTRRLTKEIQYELTKLGIDSIRIVDGDEDVKLSARARIVNEYCKKDRCILVSVHLNATPNATGWEVWTTKKENNSDKLAQYFLDVFPEIFPDEKLRGAKEEDFTLLYKSNCPCVLTENFFMDSLKDKELLQSQDGFNKIVKLHVEAIKKYMENENID